MCTAVNYKTKDHYFGRNLDLEYSYNETVTITPRSFPLQFRLAKTLNTHYAIIGMAYVVNSYPLYYDATNEKGLSMAGLNFPGNADYKPEIYGKDNISPFEFIPWVLSQCSNLNEAAKLLERINLVKINFSDELPLAPLHWIISDKNGSLTVEPVKDGLKIYENPTGVLTNNPTFDWHLFNLHNYMGLSSDTPVNTFSKNLELKEYCCGMGAMGLPGDLSSASRFIKAVFIKENSISGSSEPESVSQFFHILDSVFQQRGAVRLSNNKYEITVYSSCCNTDKGIYYYKTYDNCQITAVDMHKENLNSSKLISYPLITEQQIKCQN